MLFFSVISFKATSVFPFFSCKFFTSFDREFFSIVPFTAPKTSIPEYPIPTRLRDAIKAKTGIEPKVTRFPGGSSTTRASKAMKTQIIERLTREGYVYQDWNCDSTDASGNKVPVEKLVKSSFCNVREVNLLMHDSFAKTTTVQALQQIIDTYRSKGYIFEVLTVDSPRFQHMKQPEKVD